LFKKLASGYQPKYNLLSTIKELREKMNEMEFEDKNFRESKFIRLNMLNYLREKNMLNDNLEWIDPKRKKLVL
jgi:hypothetical protein